MATKSIYPAILIILALLLASSLKIFSNDLESNYPIYILNHFSPTKIHPQERHTIYGGLLLPTGQYEKWLRVCRDGGCEIRFGGPIEGSGEWWGDLFHIQLEQGDYFLELLIAKPWGRDGRRTVARYGWEVTVN